MKRFLGLTRLALRESNDMGKLLTLDPDQRAVVVYAEDTFSYIQLKGYLDALRANHGVAYQYVTSDHDDPLLSTPPDGATVWFIQEQLARMMGSLECDVFLTTMPDLGNFHVPRPKSGKTVYAFHSLNSTHTAYRSGAFDNYDQFLCTGPHHVEELHRLRKDSVPELSQVGYHKLDLIRDEHEQFVGGRTVERDLVLLAPSWGPANLLEAHGSEVIQSLLAAGLRVIVRPHPQFFHSLYPKGQEVMRLLQSRFERASDVEFELSIDTQESFHRSALMISDWSGAAYEYAFGTLRPVLFIDTPQKIFNSDWQAIGLPSFEAVMRKEVGSVVSTEDVDNVGAVAASLVSGELISPLDLAELANSVVFNPGRSAEVGAQVIADSRGRA
jgi:hypothetical protein